MRDDPKSPRFPGRPVSGRRRGAGWRRGDLWLTRHCSETTTVRLVRISGICVAPHTSSRSCCARRALPISATSQSAGGRRLGADGCTGRGGFPSELRGAAPHPDGCRRAAHRHRRRARRVLRAVRERQRPPHRGSEGQERGGAGHRLEPARLPGQHGDLRRARPQHRHQLGHEFIPQAKGALRRGQDRCVPWVSARASRNAGEKHRSCDRQQCNRSSMVAVLLLHGGGQHGLRP